MQQTEDLMSAPHHHLPPLPGMLMRAVPTVVRSGKVADQIANIQARFHLPAIDQDNLKAYHETFPGLVSAIPLNYFYLVAQRAHLAAMLDKSFPWPILGMVHVGNKMQQLASINPHAAFELAVTIEMPERAATRKRVRPVYVVEFLQDNHCVVRCESTYQVGSGGKTPASRRVREESLNLNQWQALNIWDLDSAQGRRYAKLSGDYNPIHLHPWLSRWFGFAQPIIHGMYSVARVQADIEKHMQQPVQLIDVAFKRPLALPNQVVSHLHHDLGKFLISDAQGAKSYLEGYFRS